MYIVILQLLQQNARRTVAIGAVRLEVVILLHGLIVQILTVYHEEHLLDVLHPRGQLCRLKRCQRLARASGMPDIAACPDGALPLIIDGSLNPLQNLLRSGYLIGAHHEQLLLHVEYAVFRQDVQDSVLGEEGGSEISEVCQQVVLLIRPVGCKLKSVPVRLVLTLSAGVLCLLGKACGVRIILRLSAVRDHKHLHKVEHGPACPERIPQIAVDLVERLLDGNASAFQFDMHQWQSIHEDGHIVAILISALHLVLIDHLQTVVIDVGLVNQTDILRLAIIHRQVQDIALALNHLRLILDGHLVVRDHRQQARPLCIAQSHIVEQLQLMAQVLQQSCLILHLHILIALSLQLSDQSLLQLSFALIALSRLGLHVVVCHHRLVLLFYYDLIVNHSNAEIICMVFPSISTSRVCEKAMRVRWLQESASDALTSDDVSRSYAFGLSIS